MVFGTIAIIDFRFLGIASTQRSFKRMASDILKWTWAAFALTALTGALMFITNAHVYYHNFLFPDEDAAAGAFRHQLLVFELTAAGRFIAGIRLRQRRPRARLWRHYRWPYGSASFSWAV